MYYEIATQPSCYPMHGSDSLTAEMVELQQPAFPESHTVGFVEASVEILPVPLNEMIPLSFLNSLADFNAGRVVDIHIALSDPPPGACDI